MDGLEAELDHAVSFTQLQVGVVLPWTRVFKVVSSMICRLWLWTVL